MTSQARKNAGGLSHKEINAEVADVLSEDFESFKRSFSTFFNDYNLKQSRKLEKKEAFLSFEKLLNFNFEKFRTLESFVEKKL